jgi:hypothetical protein
MRPFCALGAVVLLACHKPVDTSEPVRPEVELYGVRMESFRGVDVVAHGVTQEMTYERARADVTALGARVIILRGAGSLEASRLEAPKVVGNLISRGVDGSGGVSVLAANGTRAKTESAHFDSASRIATGSERVSVEGAHYSLNAVGFSMDFREQTFNFQRDVESQLGGAP